MTAFSKRKKLAREKLEQGQAYTVEEALSLVKELATSKFTESVDDVPALGHASAPPGPSVSGLPRTGTCPAPRKTRP